MTKIRGVASRRLLTTADVADVLNCSVRTLEQHRQLGTGPKFLKLLDGVRYRVEDLELYITSAERASTKGATP